MQHPNFDIPTVATMLDIEEYESIFPEGGYSEGLVSDILDNQHILGGRTFFERLLELLHIKCTSHPSAQLKLP